MSTNYYWHQSNGWAPLHIGKKSSGWTFSFRGHPELGIKSYTDWKYELKGPGVLKDEYGGTVAIETFLAMVDEAGKEPENKNHAELYGDMPGWPACYLDPDGYSFYDGEFC